MNADEAWDDYVRTNSIKKGEASLQGQLATMQAQMNELSTAVQLMTQVANKMMGEQGAADAAAGGAPPMVGGAPPMDPAAMAGADPMAGGAPPMGEGDEPLPAPPGGGDPMAMLGEEDEEVEDEGGDDADIQAFLDQITAGPQDEEGGPVPDEGAGEPVPEEGGEVPPAEGEAPAEEGAPEPAGPSTQDVNAAYEQFLEALKGLAHMAVEDNRLYLVDAIATGINAISAAWGSRICPILDELGLTVMTAEPPMEGAPEGGEAPMGEAPPAEAIFTKSYNIRKSAPLVKGMGRSEAVSRFMKSGWTISKMDGDVNVGAEQPEGDGEAVPTGEALEGGQENAGMNGEGAI